MVWKLSMATLRFNYFLTLNRLCCVTVTWNSPPVFKQVLQHRRLEMLEFLLSAESHLIDRTLERFKCALEIKRIIPKPPRAAHGRPLTHPNILALPGVKTGHIWIPVCIGSSSPPQPPPLLLHHRLLLLLSVTVPVGGRLRLPLSDVSSLGTYWKCNVTRAMLHYDYR